MPSKIVVEYCDSCGHKKQFEELASKFKEELPDAEVTGKEGRRGSFEVSVDGVQIHSKLQTLAFPDYDDVVELAKDSEQGNLPKRQAKQQPINCCIS